jgi:hypothetical protein
MALPWYAVHAVVAKDAGATAMAATVELMSDSAESSPLS